MEWPRIIRYLEALPNVRLENDNNDVVFGENNEERMEIIAAHNLLVGTINSNPPENFVTFLNEYLSI